MKKDYRKCPVMVVEDCQPSMSLLNSLLGYKGKVNLLMMVCKEQTLSYLDESEVTAVILELTLPIDEKLVLLKQITAKKPDTPVIIIIDADQVETGSKCLELGAFQYLIKPVTVEQLADCIEKAFDFLCLTQVASLLREMPFIHHGMVSDAPKDSCQNPITVPVEVPQRFRKALDYMELNLSNPLQLETIAAKASLSKYHFSRQFKKHIGMSPIKFIMSRRICLSTLLLQSTELSISNIAINSGFNDQSEFTKWFKKATGFTPSCYKKSFRSKE